MNDPRKLRRRSSSSSSNVSNVDQKFQFNCNNSINKNYTQPYLPLLAENKDTFDMFPQHNVNPLYNFSQHSTTNNNNYGNAYNNNNNNDSSWAYPSSSKSQSHYNFYEHNNFNYNSFPIAGSSSSSNIANECETPPLLSLPINPLKRAINASNLVKNPYYIPPKIESPLEAQNNCLLMEKIRKIKVQPRSYESSLMKFDCTNEDANDLAMAVKKIGIHKIEKVEADERNALPFIFDDDPIIKREKKEVYASDIMPMTFPKNLKDKMFEIFLSEVNSPNRFWFSISSETEALDILMGHIEDYYEQLKYNELLIKKDFIQKGQICCAIFCSAWHRGEIVSELKNDDKAEVYFVDYGTTTEVPLEQIKYLLPKFAELPRQVMRGSLYGITSVGHRWTRESTYDLMRMITNIKLKACAVEIDEEHNIVSMILYDTTKEEKILINDKLVSAGHAKMIDVDNLKMPRELRRRYFSEVFPTFESLEIGEYPSFEKIGELLQKGIDFEHLDNANDIAFDKMFITNTITTINVNNTNPFYNMDIVNDDDNDDEISEEDKNVNKKLKQMHVDPEFVENNHIFVSKISNPFT